MVNFDGDMEEYLDDFDESEKKEKITQQVEPEPEQDIKVPYKPDEPVNDTSPTPVVRSDVDIKHDKRVAENNNFVKNNNEESDKIVNKFSQMLEPSIKEKNDNKIYELEDQMKNLNEGVEEKFKVINEEHVGFNKEIENKINRLLEDNNILKSRVADALELINDDQIKYTDDRVKRLENEFNKLKNSIVDRDDKIEALTETTIEMILIEMETLSDSLNDADGLLDDIGTRRQFDDIKKNEKNVGLNAAYKISVSYLEDAATNAKQIKPVLREIKMNLKTINEKLKHASER